ncbi:MAG TPA: glycosyl hydrolase [Prolixibacteraceae bacterium]|nr:glycosyl hydrolase [Prolixibacteraceae bacterium]
MKNLYKNTFSVSKKNYCLSLILFFFLCAGNIKAQTGELVTTVEAEDGIMTGVRVENSIAGFSGIGYVTGFDDSSDKVTVTVTVSKKAFYQILIRYHSNDVKTQNMSINGEGAGGIDFPKSTVFTNKDAGKYLLNAGANAITIQSSWGWTEFDKFMIYTTIPNSYANVVTDLVDSKASVATKSLYSFMCSQYTNRIISGQTEGQGDFDIIKKASGNYPLLRGYDLQPYSPMYSYSWANGGFAFGPANDSPNVQNAINWYNSNSKRPIIQFQWHWHSPSGGTVGTNTFYTENTTFDVSKAVVSGTQENKDALRDIDVIAVQLKKLCDAGVPVVWRPLHEAGGTWFWWNAKGGANYIKLWNILYDRIVNYHQIHNLIWAWTGNGLAWYPGNSKVDILGIDSYPGNFNYTINKGEFDKNYVIGGGKKIVAMTENGPIPNIQDSFDGDAPWSYFMSWYDVNVGNDNQHLNDVFTNPKVITLENDTFPMIISASNVSICNSESALLNATANFGDVNWFAEPTGGAILHSGTNFTTQALTTTTTFYVEASFNGQPSEMKRTPVTVTFSVPAAPAISSDGITLQSSAPDGNQWYFNNTLIPNAVNNTYIPEERGNYYSIVTIAECSSAVSNVINFTFTGVYNLSGNIGICIFPNPVEQGKSISISGIDFAESLMIKIFDVNGKIVYSGSPIGQTIELGKGIVSGIYLVNVIAKDKVYCERLIVK